MIDRSAYNNTDGATSGVNYYYGYIPDLLKELSNLIHFSYQLNIVPDEKYGHKVKSQTSKWNGMIGELQSAVSYSSCFSSNGEKLIELFSIMRIVEYLTITS
jgi:hypothetical protein